jgi:hypothetical protein
MKKYSWYNVEFVCNDEKDSTTIYAESRAEAAKEVCRYIKSRGSTYQLLKITKII